LILEVALLAAFWIIHVPLSSAAPTICRRFGTVTGGLLRCGIPVCLLLVLVLLLLTTIVPSVPTW